MSRLPNEPLNVAAAPGRFIDGNVLAGASRVLLLALRHEATKRRDEAQQRIDAINAELAKRDEERP